MSFIEGDIYVSIRTDTNNVQLLQMNKIGTLQKSSSYRSYQTHF